MRSSEEESTGPVIRDRRRIDPATGQVRDLGQSGSPRGADSPLRGGPGLARPGKHAASKPGGGAQGAARGNDRQGGPDDQAAEPGGPGDGKPADDQAAALARLAERTADLQRLQAEYANYRKRVERDRVAVREQALANVLAALLPVLDDIGRAREHEELAGGFKSVAESLQAAVAKLGLTSYGESGDPFDPNLHEALMHSYSAEVTEPTCVTVLQPGYKIGDRILRPARVAVAEPGDLADLGGIGDSPGAEPAAGQTPDADPDSGAAGGSPADDGAPPASDPD
jgi:molecular chaperone GrpE